MKVTKEDRQHALEILTRLATEGQTVYSVLRSVSRSGMQRKIDFYVIQDNRPMFLSWAISKVCGYAQKDGALVVNGCGMDMGFSVVYDLGMELYGKGNCLRQEWI